MYKQKTVKNIKGSKMTFRIKKTAKVALVSVLLFLTGCSTMNSEFDCAHKPGVSCRSLDQVNDMVNQGVIGKDDIKESKNRNHADVNQGRLGFSTTGPLRTGERVVRIWTAPYQDVSGNYHDEGVIRTVVNKNNWVEPNEATWEKR